MSVNKNYTPKEDQEILDLFNSGLDFKEIGEQLGRPTCGIKTRYHILDGSGTRWSQYKKDLHAAAVGLDVIKKQKVGEI